MGAGPNITSADWSLMLDSTAQALGMGSGIGQVVQGLADIEQCIQIILTTPLGSDPLRPTFGCDLFQFIDQPLSLALPALVAAASAALAQWEPRITVQSITAQAVAPATLAVSVTWELVAAPGGSRTTTVTIGGGGTNVAA